MLPAACTLVRFCQWCRHTASPDTTIRKDSNFVFILIILLSKRKPVRRFYCFWHNVGRSANVFLNITVGHTSR